MKVIIAGGRDFNDYELLKNECNQILSDMGDVTIISGKCKSGADFLGEKYAKENDHPVMEFPADWKKHGRAAGPIRNAEMAEVGDVLIAFWDQSSKGTKSMIRLAEKNNLKVHVVKY